MILLNPNKHTREYPDEKSRQAMLKTIEFFEAKGKTKLKEDDHARVWYSDFLGHVGSEHLFATMCTPAGYGADDARWDTWRNCEFAEILGFYGLQYWYTWQVSVLGLGPIWMSKNEEQKQRAAKLLQDGEVFAFALSEQSHGADVYSTDMVLTPQPGGGYLASGEKYYIGNANAARMISTFGRIDGTEDYVFFVSDSQHEKFDLIKNVVNSQNYVANFALREYPVAESDILHRGQEAWNAALNTVNIGKYNLGWASIGICTHALYEAITHASNRKLYGMHVTDFSHVKQMFVDAYTRLTAMKLVALRAADYMRTASADDRRYLLYNPVVKMKVTTQGEDVINSMWDAIAAKGFEKDMYFEMAARDIRALPKLEGTVHVNIALIVKFMPNFFFGPAEYPLVEKRSDAANDDFLFDQGATRGLSKIQFHDYEPIFNHFDLPNIRIFKEQIAVFKELLATAPPDDGQRKDVDFLMSLGEIFVCIVYAQMLLENARIYAVDEALIDQMFDFMIRDVARHAVTLHGKPTTTDTQMDFCMKLIRKPAVDEARYEKVWNEVHALNGLYEMPL